MKVAKANIRIKFTESLLATSSGNPEVHEEFQASKSRDAEKVQEEMLTLPKEEVVEKASTVFMKDEQGIFVYDYTWRGHFKEGIGHLCDLGELKKLNKWNYKKAVDACVFVNPRRVHLYRDGKILQEPDDTLQRPLRAQTMQGERIALARSQLVIPGTTCSFEVALFISTSPKSPWSELSLNLLRFVLELGIFKGSGQWRSGGWGRFKFEMEELPSTELTLKAAA